MTDAELEAELLRMTDSHTDELFAIDPTLAMTVAFPVSRLVVDPERFEDDTIEPMSTRGMGVLYTRTSYGSPLRMSPGADERNALLTRFYHPHHERLTIGVDAVLKAQHSCLILDCHSFPSKALPYEMDQSHDRPDVCLGTDSFHTPTSLLTFAKQASEAAGFSVAVDRPFSGALVPMRHYGRDRRVSALMIEINRGRYMDEQTGLRLPAFDGVQRRIRDLMHKLIAHCTIEGY